MTLTVFFVQDRTTTCLQDMDLPSQQRGIIFIKAPTLYGVVTHGF